MTCFRCLPRVFCYRASPQFVAMSPADSATTSAIWMLPRSDSADSANPSNSNRKTVVASIATGCTVFFIVLLVLAWEFGMTRRKKRKGNIK